MKNFLILFSLLFPFLCSAQELKVKSMDIQPNDISARTNPRTDLNGNLCALLKIYVNDDIAEVQGNCMGDVVDKGMEKWVYVADHTKEIIINFRNHFPLKISFKDYNYHIVSEGMTYIIKLVEDKDEYITSESDSSVTISTKPTITGETRISDSKSDIKTVTVEYDYVVSPKETLEEGRLHAIEQAQIKAIGDAFGSTLSQTNYSSEISNHAQSASSFNSYSIADVNGEWLETLSMDGSTLIHQNGITLYKVKLKGKIRKISSNSINLEVAVLANGTDPRRDRAQNEAFMEGDYFYLYFQSPVDGYLAVYLADCDESAATQCLVPYRGVNEGAMRVEANKPYILFSREHAAESIKSKVGRIKMGCNNPVDYNRLYVLFSPNEFVKVVDKDNEGAGAVIHDKNGTTIHTLPRETDFSRFQKWLTKTRLKDPDMQVITTILRIQK